MIFAEIFFAMDTWLIAPFRWITPAPAGFMLGTAILALECVLAGKLCLALMNLVQRRLRRVYDEEVIRRQDLSMQALAVKNKNAYLAQNHLAQEAYGKSMSLAMGRAGASLWPAVMALAWMKGRFYEAPFPLPSWLPGQPKTVSYGLMFFLFYILTHAAWAKFRRRKRAVK